MNEEKTKKTKKIKSGLVSKIFFTIFLLIALAGAGVSLAVTLYGSNIVQTLPEINPETLIMPLTSKIYDNQGQFITSRYDEQNREWVNYDTIPAHYINGLVAVEDKTFWEHEGIDPMGIVRASVVNIQSKDASQGASTLTQQLARNLFIPEENRFAKKYERKVKEAFIALNLEKKMSKEDILTYYANVINFGENAYGIKSAAMTYFGKNLEDLTLAENALLAGIPQAPHDNDPVLFPEAALARRNVVLDAMLKSNYITKAEWEEAVNTPITLNITKTNTNTQFGFFIDPAIAEAEDILRELKLPSLYVGGYQLHTTLDSRAQTLLEAQFADPSNFPDDVNGEQAQGAMVVYDQTTGEVKAMMGGRSYDAQLALNRALTKTRQPGSTFKPIVDYGPAIELGLTANDTYVDGPININGYKPTNAGGGYSGVVTVRTAIQNSINTVAVQVLNDIGVETGWNFAKRLGIELAPEDKEYLSIAIGGVTVGPSPLEMARAFGTFGNQGVLEEAHYVTKIVGPDGTVIYEAPNKGEQVISPSVAWYMTDLLQGVVNAGTGTQAKLPITMAGKTGTTDMENVAGGNKDLWFIGYTPKITASVWIGFDNTNADNAMYGQYGGGYPARLWRNFMSEYLDLVDVGFTKPNPLETIPLQFKKKNIVAPPKAPEPTPGVKIIDETDTEYIVEVPPGTNPEDIVLPITPPTP